MLAAPRLDTATIPGNHILLSLAAFVQTACAHSLCTQLVHTAYANSTDDLLAVQMTCQTPPRLAGSGWQPCPRSPADPCPPCQCHALSQASTPCSKATSAELHCPRIMAPPATSRSTQSSALCLPSMGRLSLGPPAAAGSCRASLPMPGQLLRR